jgi:DHA1 family bicyclomycin/chloramphenicol resistance-like MFS transporter
MKNSNKKRLIIFTLGLLSAIGPFSIDMYLPGFPQIAASLHTTVSHVSLSLSSFFVGISVGQLIYGPLLDRYGRKIPLYAGLAIYFLSSIYCAFINDADSLIVMRFFQALGSCGGMVAARALVRDLFPVRENARVFSLLMLVIALSPILAPTFGGFISTSMGWHAIFISLAIISLLTSIAVYLWLPNGRKPDKGVSLKPVPIIRTFITVFKVPRFYTYSLAGAIASSGLYSYVAGSPVVFMKIYRVSEKHYGLIFAFISLGLLVASQLNTILLRRYSSEKITLIALIGQVITGLLLVSLTSLDVLNLYSMIALIWIFLGTQGFVFPNTSALALSPFKANAGTASALMGAVQLGIGALATALVGALSDKTAMPMAGIMSVCALSALIILLAGRANIKREMTIRMMNDILHAA